MNSATAERLLELNRRFYSERGRDFSATRLRLQPGVKHLLETLRGGESILDLGCGNGQLARSLSRRGHQGSYLGLDSSPVLLAEAADSSFSFPVRFEHADLAQPSWDHVITDDAASAPPVHKAPFDIILCFAVLHHLPGSSLRFSILCKVHDLLAPNGHFMLSSWRFSQSPRMIGRIQPWSDLGLTSQDVDPDDYLLDWKRGGKALRYVHQFDEVELAGLAAESGFEVIQTFCSDGADHKSSLYQIWRQSQG